MTWEEWAKSVNDKLTELSNRVDHIARNMALLSQVQSLRQDFNELCDELIETLFLKPMSEAIISALKDTPHLTKPQIVARLLKPSSRQPLRWHAFYKAWEVLEKDGAITDEHHGQGHARTWILTEKETHS